MALMKLFDLESIPNVAGRFIYDELSPRDLITMSAAHPIIANFASQTRRRPKNLSVSLHPSPTAERIFYVLIKAEFPDKEPLYWYLDQENRTDCERKPLNIGNREYLTAETTDENRRDCLISYVPKFSFMESLKEIFKFITDFYDFPIKRLGFYKTDEIGYPEPKDFCALLPDVEEFFLDEFGAESKFMDIVIARAKKQLVSKFNDFTADEFKGSYLPFIKSESLSLCAENLTKKEIFEEVTRRMTEIDYLKKFYMTMHHLQYQEFMDLRRELNLEEIPQLPDNFVPAIRIPTRRNTRVSNWIQKGTVIENGTRPIWIFQFSGFSNNSTDFLIIDLCRFDPKYKKIEEIRPDNL